ncbi:MAG: hypothetical protein J2P13_04095 [Acidobacteria bacterium]|nr:hypothetical protein [Acidobacteriota bacterium]
MKPMFFRAMACATILIASAATEPLLAQVGTQQPPAGSSTQPPIELPENPGRNSKEAPKPASPAPENSSPQRGTRQPSGTAVAPAPEVSGSAASKPAGVAIAPPRQRQVRSWLIRFGFIAGAGAALGTVAALSAASPSRVPGAPSH